MRKVLLVVLAAAAALLVSCSKDDLREALLAGTYEATYSSIDYGTEVKDRTDWVKHAYVHFDGNGTGWSRGFFNYDVHLCTDEDASFFQNVDSFRWSIADGELMITATSGSKHPVRSISLDENTGQIVAISYLLSDQYKVVVKGKRVADIDPDDIPY